MTKVCSIIVGDGAIDVDVDVDVVFSFWQVKDVSVSGVRASASL